MQLKERRSSIFRVSSGTFCLYVHLEICNSLLFLHKRLVALRSQSFAVLDAVVFAVHRVAMLLALFWQKKIKTEDYTSYLFCINTELQFQNT